MAKQLVEVDVVPQFVHGTSIICDVDSPSGHLQHGHIRLKKGQTYTVEFRLNPGNPRDLHFKPDQDGNCEAFWSHEHHCPETRMNARQYSNARLETADKLQVDVNLEQERDPSAVHYRLNFDDGHSFDPIIIHE